MTIERNLSELLHQIGAVRFGQFTLKDGRVSPFYLDLRILIAHPSALARVGRALARHAQGLRCDRIAAIPYAGLPIGVAMSLISGRPLIYARKEAKDHGTKQLIEGEFHPGERALVVDDVITSGSAKLEVIASLRAAGLTVEDVLVVVDREDRGAAVLADAGLRLHSVLKVRVLLDYLHAAGAVSDRDWQRSRDFLEFEKRSGSPPLRSAKYKMNRSGHGSAAHPHVKK